ncbi:hypothetical protein B0A55_12961 [Friedmanniomyces simplex]|uniref:Uncharacterized protein n=1 Tax=Friedmanniomyces simplex TaxID=329884 RepID=A0A4U0WBZ4_9PEZI|nr:hypothetical protein B0A55_12961 [Friedmanniomyces simplex]
MSQDLFAEFGSQAPPLHGIGDAARGHEQSRGPGIGPESATPDRATLVPLEGDRGKEIDEEDDFGDFEDASNAASASYAEPTAKAVSKTAEKTTPRAPEKTYPPPRPLQAEKKQPPSQPAKDPPDVGRHPFANHMDLLFAADDDEYDAGADEIADLATNPEAAMAYSKRVIAAQQANEFSGNKNASASVRGSVEPKHEPRKLRKKSAYVPAPNTEVMFDAEDDPPDDFGDFEGASDGAHKSSAAPSGSAMPDVDLLALDERDPQRSATTSEPTRSLEEDAWDDFEDSAIPVVDARNAAASSNVARESPFQRTMGAIAPKASATTGVELLPPTNMPPPAVLLSIFPSIFASGQEALLDPVSKLDMKQRQVLLAHPATHLFLRGYLGLAVVLGHIVAGRKLRWKRDQYLAQGMRIGPAAAGGKSGMKLAGVDKSEVAKEDREALDALRLWKSQIGKLRSAVAAASATTPDGEIKLPPVPEISEQSMPVRTVKAIEGGITAPHACALCGLKREERVAKVDVEVNDSFGEWWVEGMNMHLLCRNFWEEHKGKLRTR